MARSIPHANMRPIYCTREQLRDYLTARNQAYYDAFENRSAYPQLRMNAREAYTVLCNRIAVELYHGARHRYAPMDAKLLQLIAPPKTKGNSIHRG
jgi:hypothetical protein